MMFDFAVVQLETVNEKREIWFDADEKQNARPIRLGAAFF